MTSFRIALLQIAPKNTLDENLERGLKACRVAKSKGAHLALFPEMWSIGYEPEKMDRSHAIDASSVFLRAFSEHAKFLNMAIGVTFLGLGQKKPTNSMILFDRFGSSIFHYRKVRICDFKGGTECGLERGTEFFVHPLDFEEGTVQIGAMICFDREFPESARELARLGAEVIITPNACKLKLDDHIGDVRLAQFRARAFENMVGVAMANYPEPFQDGHSCAFGVDGREIEMATENEGIFVAEFDLDQIRTWQKSEVWGVRKPV